MTSTPEGLGFADAEHRYRLDARIATGDMVVTEGVQSVRDGGAVRVAGNGGEQQAADAAGS